MKKAITVMCLYMSMSLHTLANENKPIFSSSFEDCPLALFVRITAEGNSYYYAPKCKNTKDGIWVTDLNINTEDKK